MNGFAIILGIGASLGMWRLAQRVPRWQSERWMNSGLVVLFATLLGARAGFVLISLDYFASHLLEIPQIWLGGLTWPGAIAGALSGLFIEGRRWRISAARLADGLLPLLPPITIAAWLGSWQASLAYGPTVPGGAWWGLPVLDQNGQTSLRLPLQAAAAFSMLLFFGWLEIKFPAHARAGQPAGLAALGLAVSLLLASFLRADPAPLWGGVRYDIWLAGGFCLFSLLVTIRSFLPNNDLA